MSQIDSDVLEDAMSTMNVIYENEKIITKSVTHSSIEPTAQDVTVIRYSHSVPSSLQSTPNTQRIPRRELNLVKVTRNDFWNMLENIMGTRSSQESVNSGLIRTHCSWR